MDYLLRIQNKYNHVPYLKNVYFLVFNLKEPKFLLRVNTQLLPIY